jgi:GNAT superfamily N-acetyltransferase
MTISHECEACGTTVLGDDVEGFGDAYIAHVRSSHPDWPYPDQGIRNYAEATQRLTGSRQRLETIDEVVVHPIAEDRIDDWLSFFDHDAFADNAGWAACYCSEPHVLPRGTPPEEAETRPWRQNREIMVGLLRSGRSFGYLAYVDGRPAGWVNASKREACALYRLGAGADPADGDVVSVSCFMIAPPYRRHGLAATLLERVLSDAPGRGVGWIESYPANGEPQEDARNFRGPRSMFEAYGFEPGEARERDTVMRLQVPGTA